MSQEGTLQKIMSFARERPDVIRFFRTTWIPDETFFQTLVRHLIPREEIESRTLTFLMFSDYGMPLTFYNDHYDLLLSQNHLFARKVSAEAKDLKRRLGQLYAAKGVNFPISDEGRNLFRFVSHQGRIGRRFATRFWETESSLGRQRELLIIISKKWHVAKRLLHRIREHTHVPGVAYLFNEENTELPDLGGIQNTLEKRQRHRRALVRMLFDYYQTDRLVICMDPGNLDLIKDFASDRSTTRILEIDCTFTEEQLTGHAIRMGLAGDQTSGDSIARLLPTIRNTMLHEADRIRDAQFENHHLIQEDAPEKANQQALGAFITADTGTASEILSGQNAFAD